MTLVVQLPAELERRLESEAERRGVNAETLTRQLLEQQLPAQERPSRLRALLDSWIEGGDAAEQRETGRFLVKALDDDRSSARRLFPPELEGVTW